MRLASALAVLLLLPGLGFAQQGERARALNSPVANAPAIAGTQVRRDDVMPLWGTSDGRILAMVAFGAASHGAPVMPQAPHVGSAADWQLIDVTNFITGGLSMRFGDSVSTYASFGRGIVLEPLNPAAASLGCGSYSIGLPVAQASCAGLQQPLADSGSLQLGTDLSAGDLSIDLNYGLSWLHYADRTPAFGAGRNSTWGLLSSVGNEALPTLVVPGMQPNDMRNVGFNASGHWRLSNTQSFDLGAALSRIRFELPGTTVTPVLNQAALSFGVHHGDFSGIIVGRMLGSSDPLSGGQHWSSVDLGISWRAPWRGIFSVGAQNLWSSGAPPLSLTPAAPPAIDPGSARVPYVQYHQDL